MNDEIFRLIEKFAEEKAQEEQVTVYHLLSAFAKLLSMNQNLLKNMFSDETSEDKIKQMYVLVEDKNIDIRLMKQSFSIILSNLTDVQKDMTIERVFEDNENIKDSTELFGRLFKLELPEFDLITKGKTLDDTFSFVEQHPREKKEPECKKEKKEKKEMAEAEKQVTVESDIKEQHGRTGFQKLIAQSKQLYVDLLGRVKGQDEAIRTFVEGYFQAEIFREQEKKKKPGATFLFAGPPGVGKTFLAESAAEFLGLPFARFDMSEYCDNLSTSVFAGTEKKYSGAKPGTVTGFVEENPRCILLFDEIEKAHMNVIYLFLQILDGGIITDNYTEKKVLFKDTILLFTTNVGKKLYEKQGDSNLSSLPKSVVLDAIKKETNESGEPAFPAAICSRFASGNVVMFNHLAGHHLIDIVQDCFEQTVQMAQKQYNYNLIVDPRLATVFLFNQSSSADARTASSQSVILIKNELYEFARHLSKPEQTLGKIESISFGVDVPKEDSRIRELFFSDEKIDVLVFGDKNKVGLEETLKFAPDYACDIESAKQILKKKDYAYVLIDLFLGTEDRENGPLSMDDWGTIGIRFFEWLRENLPDLPVYLLENKEIDIEDKATFLQRGARGFVVDDSVEVLERELAALSDNIYLQHKLDELTSRGKSLAYNTLQTISEDGRRAEIRFYDFKLKSAVNADVQDVMLADNRRPGEKFRDVIGAENAKQELQYFVNYMKNPKKYIIDGIKLPKGILLYGPPGTGKTMLARAMAGESEVSFFPVTAAGFQDKYIGEGEKKIRNLFAMAKSYAPSIIFIDEIDAIGKERTGSTSTHHTESLLNTLLTEMDGFEVDKKKPVFVLAATNYDLDGTTSGKQAAIDGALLRRFDNRIYVDLPNEAERKQFLLKLVEKRSVKGVSENTLENIAKRTTGESLAILQNVFELGVRSAARKGKSLDDETLLNAFEEYNYGEKHEWSESYYKEVAVHESGHALVNWLSGGKPSFITIVSRGNFGGYMQPENGEQNPNYSKEELIWKIRTCLAGRAAEIVFFGEEKGINTGVSSDLRMATNYAVNMFALYGMSENSLVSFDPQTLLNSARGEALLVEADALLKREMAYTMSLIESNRHRIEKLSQRLIEKNQVMTEEILEVLEEE